MALLTALLLVVSAKEPVIWRASKVVTRAVPAGVGHKGGLSAYFSAPDTVEKAIAVNPGIATAKKLRDLDEKTSMWEGRTAPIPFGPTVSVTSVVTFKITFDPEVPVLEFEAVESTTESTGPAIIRKFIDSILPEVSSRNTITITDDDTMCSDTFLQLELPLPGWLPLPRLQIEKGGPPILEQQLEKDLGQMLDNFMVDYARSCREGAVVGAQTSR